MEIINNSAKAKLFDLITNVANAEINSNLSLDLCDQLSNRFL